MKNKNLKMELYKLNEMPSGWTVENDVEAAEALEDLKRSDREILERYKPSDMARAIESRAKKSAKDQRDDKVVGIGRMMAVRVLIPAAAAAVLALSVLLPVRTSDPTAPVEEIRIKGAAEPELKVYRRSGEESELLDPESSAGESDLLQLSYSVKESAFGLIISIDGRGVVTRHLPEEGADSPRLETGGERFLPYSYELDDAPGFETFYLIISASPFSTEKVMDAAARAAENGQVVQDIPTLTGNDKLDQLSISIRKD